MDYLGGYGAQISAVITLGLICGCITLAIGKSKYENGWTFWRGALFGVLGILFGILTNGNTEECPYCMKKIAREASICPYCQQEQAPEEAEPVDDKILV